MNDPLFRLCEALSRAKAPVLFGLDGISAENQHAVYRLARTLGASVSVEPALLPTLTRASLARHGLILLAGGAPDFPLPEGADVLRDDRLLSDFAWRALAALARGHALPGADAYAALHDALSGHGGAAFLITADTVAPALSDALSSFRENCALPLGLDYMQLSGTVNRLSAYTVALEEAGGAHACFAGGKPLVSPACALASLLQSGSADAALLIGSRVPGLDAAAAAGVPLYALSAEPVPEAAICVRVPPFPDADGGVLTLPDGLTQEYPIVPGSETLAACLETLIAEVRA